MEVSTDNKKSLRVWWIAGVVAALIGGGIWFYNDVLDPLFLVDRWGEVVPGKLYRSGDLPPYTAQSLLADHHIGLVIKLSGVKMEQLHHRKEAEAVKNLSIEMNLIPMRGNGVSSVEQYANAIEAIVKANRENKAVLVHCAAGTNRTGGVIAVYRILIQHLPADQSYREMRRYGLDPADNTELVPFLNANLPAIAQLLYDRHVIPAVPDPIPHLGP
ncbi:MAG: dual specificity protein phosphatase family protein [Phycisphaeraceae bacterium]